MSKCFSAALICFLLVANVRGVPEGRIIGGKSALAGQFPHQVSVQLNGEHNCGGSIISKLYILTAAHCVINKKTFKMYPNSALRVQAGTIHRTNGGVAVSVGAVIVNSDYISKGNIADIALIMLTKPLAWSKTIQPIALSKDNVPEKSSVTISGWGLLQNSGDMADHLQWTVLQSISQKSCYSLTGYNSDKFLCLGHSRNKGACFGDSGGPAEIDHRLVGVASFTSYECATDNPDLYVKVYSYLNWIKKHSDLKI